MHMSFAAAVMRENPHLPIPRNFKQFRTKYEDTKVKKSCGIPNSMSAEFRAPPPPPPHTVQYCSKSIDVGRERLVDQYDPDLLESGPGAQCSQLCRCFWGTSCFTYSFQIITSYLLKIRK